MPTEPTAQPVVLPVPDPDTDLPVVAVDLGADGLPDHLRALAMTALTDAGLSRFAPDGPLPTHGVPGWHAQFAAGWLTVSGPAHVVYDGELAVWPALAAAVADNRYTMLFAGHIALGLGAEVMPAVRQAAARGECAGGIIPAEHIRN